MNYFLNLVTPGFDFFQNYTRKIFKEDLISGLIAAIVILPQAAALATLAGLPPHYGVYASIFPVMAAALFGSSWHSISGPNTAVALMVLSAVVPWGNAGSQDYIALALTLAFLVGLIQMLLALFKFGVVMDFVSTSVVNAVSNAVGIIIIVSAASGFFGVPANIAEPFYLKLWNMFFEALAPNKYALIVGVATVVSGLIARKFIRRYSLVIAMLIGIVTERSLAIMFGSSTTAIELVGNLPLSALPLSMPNFKIEAFVIWKSLITSAFSIAFVGILQTVVIAKSLAEKSGQNININKEIFGQGISNMVASFFSGFAGSASFNRSSAHYESGARTPVAAFASGIFLFLIIFTAGVYIAYLSVPAISGVLILVGYGLINSNDFKNIKFNRAEAIIFYSVLLLAIFSSISDAVITGVIMSVIVYLSRVSRPIITVTRSESTGHNKIHVRGSLFFGSINSLLGTLAIVANTDQRKKTLILDLQDALDFDSSAVRALQLEAQRRDFSGGRLVLHMRKSQLNVLSPGVKLLLNAFVDNDSFASKQDGADTIVELQVKSAVPRLKPLDQ